MTTPNLPAPIAAETGETNTTALAARARAEIEARTFLAAAHPRDFMRSRQKLLAACARPRFCEAARYLLPRGGKKIEGWSVRFAEELLRVWGNVEVSAVVTWEDAEKQVRRVTITDLESNVAVSDEVVITKQVERSKAPHPSAIRGRRKNSKGEDVFLVDATPDDLRMLIGAESARVRRTLILQLVPSDLLEEAQQVVRETMDGEAKADPLAVRKRCADAFATFGLSATQVSEVLFDGTPIAEINEAQLQLARTICAALKEGDVTWADVREEFGARTAKADAAAPTPTEGRTVDELGVRKPVLGTSLADRVRARTQRLEHQPAPEGEA